MFQKAQYKLTCLHRMKTTPKFILCLVLPFCLFLRVFKSQNHASPAGPSKTIFPVILQEAKATHYPHCEQSASHQVYKVLEYSLSPDPTPRIITRCTDKSPQRWCQGPTRSRVGTEGAVGHWYRAPRQCWTRAAGSRAEGEVACALLRTLGTYRDPATAGQNRQLSPGLRTAHTRGCGTG